MLLLLLASSFVVHQESLYPDSAQAVADQLEGDGEIAITYLNELRGYCWVLLCKNDTEPQPYMIQAMMENGIEWQGMLIYFGRSVFFFEPTGAGGYERLVEAGIIPEGVPIHYE
jgi:hypothetical protein